MAATTSVYYPVDQVLLDMAASLQAQGSALTDFTGGSNVRTLSEAVAIVVAKQSQVMDQLQQDSYLDTATGSALDAIASDFLVPRLAAVQATGQVTITRQDTSGALILTAGWGQLATSPSAPGQSGVSLITTQDAIFPVGTAAVTVAAQAVLGGSAGNLSAGVFLTPLAPVNTISSQNGYQVTGTFTNGVDAESDAAFRARIPLAVQGRVKGQVVSFKAAALGVPGVLSAGVLTAGALRSDSTQVPVGSVEVYYQGSAGLLSAVNSAAISASTANQNPSAIAAVSLTAPKGKKRLIVNLGVYCHPGVDPVALAVAVSTALQGYINGSSSSVPTGLGGTAYVSQAVEAVLAVPNVASVAMPLTTFNVFGSPGAVDISCLPDSYVSLQASDVTVAVTTLPA